VIAKAITARKPRTRYTVGHEAALLTLARLLPDRLLDRVFAAALRPHLPKDQTPPKHWPTGRLEVGWFAKVRDIACG
jgi:hypothetical protein